MQHIEVRVQTINHHIKKPSKVLPIIEITLLYDILMTY